MAHSKSAPALAARHAHAFDLRPQRALAAQARDEGELQATDYRACPHCHDQLLARVGRNLRKGRRVACGQRVFDTLALAAQGIVGQKAHDGRKVVGGGRPDLEVVHCGPRHVVSAPTCPVSAYPDSRSIWRRNSSRSLVMSSLW
jgi:hypothetical protein